MRRSQVYITIFMAVSSAAGQTVIINEIAWMGTPASYTDEWIELYNMTPDSIDLNNWTLRAADGAPQILLQGRIAGYCYYVLERTDDQTISDYPAQQLYTGNLGNDGEHLILEDSSGFVMDRVDCSTEWFAGQNSPDKFTMEKKHPRAPGSLTVSWGNNNGLIKNGLDADGNPINGTPGAQNSIYTTTGVTSGLHPSETYELANFPNPFKIGTTIRFRHFSHQPVQVTVIIYDVMGHRVKVLLNANISTGYHSVVWDGRDNHGRYPGSGMYICALQVAGKGVLRKRVLLLR
ncbi:lamin tail domain-containing protein [candidate division KSB1 bacterium]|nr:lamin tail domain-containing protein [candidate division KSB1 bacterium]